MKLNLCEVLVLIPLATLPCAGGDAWKTGDPNETWNQAAEVSSDDGGAYFGEAVGLSGNTAVVGETNSAFGVAYVYTQSGGTWNQQAQISACNVNFGISVAVSGNTVVVGAPCSHLVYVWVQTGGVWSQQAALSIGQTSGVFFGYSVAVSGDTVIVGAPITQHHTKGYAYVFVRGGGKWSQQAKLTGVDTSFGQAVSINGNTAVVGAPGQVVSSNLAQGAAYVYVRSGSTWTQTAQLLSSDGAQDDQFGRSVSVSGNIALVGAANKTVNSNRQEGAAYLFSEVGGVWSQQQELFASDGAASGYFGYSVSVNGSTAVVTGADPYMEGAAYVFMPSGGMWTQQAKLTPTAGASYDHFGWCAAVSGSTILVGAPDEPSTTYQFQGAAYFFQASGN